MSNNDATRQQIIFTQEFLIRKLEFLEEEIKNSSGYSRGVLIRKKTKLLNKIFSIRENYRKKYWLEK
jgi:hypothetical protein